MNSKRIYYYNHYGNFCTWQDFSEHTWTRAREAGNYSYEVYWEGSNPALLNSTTGHRDMFVVDNDTLFTKKCIDIINFEKSKNEKLLKTLSTVPFINFVNIDQFFTQKVINGFKTITDELENRLERLGYLVACGYKDYLQSDQNTPSEIFITANKQDTCIRIRLTDKKLNLEQVIKDNNPGWVPPSQILDTDYSNINAFITCLILLDQDLDRSIDIFDGREKPQFSPIPKQLKAQLNKAKSFEELEALIKKAKNQEGKKWSS